jgi:hypothetical protein
MAFTTGVAVWSFERSVWGVCGQGPTEDVALADFHRRTGRTPRVVEHIHGDEQAFVRDFAELERWMPSVTVAILERARAETTALVADAPNSALDAAVQGFRRPPWARWNTARDVAWHVVDCESRYYVPSLGLEPKPRAGTLLAELEESAAFVRAVVSDLPPDIVNRTGEEVWTSVKLLRRLAWHERAELPGLRWLLRH